MNKENIEQIERIEKKFSYVPKILVVLMVLALLLLRDSKITIVSPLEIIFISAFVNLFFNQIILSLQIKSLLRLFKNESK